MGTGPSQSLASKLTLFQSGGRLYPPHGLVPTKSFYIPAPLIMTAHQSSDLVLDLENKGVKYPR
jgi:hypothetical protein